MGGIVKQNIARADAELIAKLGRAGVATVSEAMGQTGTMSSKMRPIQNDFAIAGSAVTILASPGDNWMVHVAIEQLQQGDIMVLAPTAPCDIAYFGDLLATAAMARGCKALVIDAGVRDTQELRSMEFAVWSSSISARGPIKETIGSVNVPIICSGVSVHAGDVIVADDDGVCVVPNAAAATVARAAEERLDREETLRQRIVAGELTLDIFDMRKRLEKKGLSYE